MDTLRHGRAVTLWAPMSSTVGGVSMSARRLEAWLDDRDRLQAVVNVLDRKRLLGAMLRHRHGPHVMWCSTLGSLSHHSLIARFLRRPRIVMVHGGPPDDTRGTAVMRVVARGVFDRILTTNDGLAAALSALNLGTEIELASAYVPTGTLVAQHSVPTRDPRCIVFVGSERGWYGLDVAVDAVELLRSGPYPDAALTAVLYGNSQPHDPASALATSRPWISCVTNIEPHAVGEALGMHEILLRPSTVDGDALVVREALDRGLRVVASDVVARPAGVEVYALSASAMAAAIVSGGTVSDGAGTGRPVTEVLAP